MTPDRRFLLVVAAVLAALIGAIFVLELVLVAAVVVGSSLVYSRLDPDAFKSAPVRAIAYVVKGVTGTVWAIGMLFAFFIPVALVLASISQLVRIVTG